MVDRRTFTALLAGTLAAPKATFAQNSMTRNVFYSAVGSELTLYSVDVDNAALVRQGTVPTPTDDLRILALNELSATAPPAAGPPCASKADTAHFMGVSGAGCSKSNLIAPRSRPDSFTNEACTTP